jgi:hypothetical protein
MSDGALIFGQSFTGNVNLWLFALGFIFALVAKKSNCLHVTKRPTLPMTAFTLKLDTWYAACLPGAGIVCYGYREDEALNNLAHRVRQIDKRNNEKDEQGRQRAPADAVQFIAIAFLHSTA